MNEWLGRIREAWAGLAPRERLLLGIAGGLVLAALVYVLVVSPVLAALSRADMHSDTVQQELRAMIRLSREYEDVKSRLAHVEPRIASSPRGNLRTTLETLATRASVRVESMEPQASPANDDYRETKVEVGLKAVTLEQTVRYLHEIEDSPQVLSVKSLRMRTRPDATGLLDVTFTVSSFEPL